MNKLFRNVILLVLFVSTVVFSAGAKDSDYKFVDADMVKALAVGHTWESKKLGGAPGYSWWSWQSNGSVCLRLNEKMGKCDDSGKWRLEANRLCWQLDWFGATFGQQSTCIRIAVQGKDRYLGIDEKGSALFDFIVLK